MNHEYCAIGNSDFKCTNCSLVKSGNIVIDEYGPENPKETVFIYYDDFGFYFNEPECGDILLKNVME